MTGLARTDLTTLQRVDLAAAAVATQGQHGMVTHLAELHSVTRDTVYSARAQGRDVLARHFNAATRPQVLLAVTSALIIRSLVALRVVGAYSIRQIQTVLSVLYPGVSASYGYIQGVVVEAEERAVCFNATIDLSALKAMAVDEMFSQGEPVLAGVDLDFGFLAALKLCDGRSGEDWAEVLNTAKKQGLDPDVFVKDAAKGIALGITTTFPDAEQRDDVFHALYEMNKVARLFEQKAYGAIGAEYELEREVSQVPKGKKSVAAKRRSLNKKLEYSRKTSERRIDRYDDFERARRGAREAMHVVDLETGELRTPEQMQRNIEAAARAMKEIGHHLATKVGTYITNRAFGLVLYAAEIRARLRALAQEHTWDAVRLAALVVRLRGLAERTQPWQDSWHAEPLVGAWLLLQRHPRCDLMLAAVEKIFVERHRASSAIEGFNAALRPHLYVHKRATQGFLELFRAYFNLRTRRWGRHKGTSPYELVTGTKVDDWLSMLGYPLPAEIH